MKSENFEFEPRSGHLQFLPLSAIENSGSVLALVRADFGTNQKYFKSTWNFSKTSQNLIKHF